MQEETAARDSSDKFEIHADDPVAVVARKLRVQPGQ